MQQVFPRETLRARLLAMMILRVVLALAFLGVTAWFQVKGHSFAGLNLTPLYAIIATVGFLTIVYALLLTRVRNLQLFAYTQLTIDIALATLIVYITGGTESYLHALYPLTVIGAAIILSKRGGFYAASVSSIAYGVLIDMDFYRMLPSKYKLIGSLYPPAWEEVFMTVATNILAFFTVAYLTGYLAERTARMERELEEKGIDYERLEALNRQIIENITSGIMTLDNSMRITSFNREAENVTGYALREVYYRDVKEIFPGMLGTDYAQSGNRPEKKFRKKTGEEIYLGFTISQGQGGDVEHIVIFQDLTRLKEMEDALRRDERMRALGELSVGIAHEIRNPLASISGSIQLLKDDLQVSGDDKRLMDIILRETDRLNRLITDYLLFAKPARELRELVDVSAIISETIEVFRNCPEASKITIEDSLTESFRMYGDARQLGQVFWNLFLNAAHAMEEGGRLTVKAGYTRLGNNMLRKDAWPGFVEVIVSDTGKGISPADMGRVFDPFFSTKDRGTGLGLSIVHRIIESHSGTIEVSSTEGRGTTFRILLPIEEHAVVN